MAGAMVVLLVLVAEASAMMHLDLSSNRCRFYARNRIQSKTEFDHAIAGVARVVGLTECMPGAGDKCGGIFIVVLATHGGWKHEFHDTCTNMLTSGDMGCEAGICHGDYKTR